MSPAGWTRRTVSTILLAFGLYVVAFGGGELAAKIGSPVIVVNNVTGAVEQGHAGAILRVGIDVFQNETITTAADSATRLLFQDNTQLEIGEKSEVTLDEFVFDPNPANSKVALSVAAGVMRFVTGKLPKEDYQITTPNASLSVRGTVFSLDVNLGNGTSLYVDDGSVFFTAGGVTVQVYAGQSSNVPPGGTPSKPTKSSNSRPNTGMHRMLKQALLSPDAAQALVNAIIGVFPGGGEELTEAIAQAVEEDPHLARFVVHAGLTATPAQQQALGAGLADAATYFAGAGADGAAEAEREIQAAMASAPGLMQTVFDNGGGTTALVTFITTSNSVLTTSNCISPSRPGNGC